MNTKPWAKLFTPLLLTGTALLLSACDFVGEKVSEKVEQKIEQVVPKATAAQNEQAAKLYQALSQKNYALIEQTASPELQAELKKSPNTLPFLSTQIPAGSAPSTPTLINIQKSIDSHYGSMLSITYQYVYPVQVVNFTVAFDGSEGSTTLKGLHLNAQVNPNSPAPTPEATPSASAPKQQAI